MLRQLKERFQLTYLCLQTPADAADAVEKAAEYCHEVVPIPHPVKNVRSTAFYGEVLWNTLFGKYPFMGSKYLSLGAIRELERRTAPAFNPPYDMLICDYLAPMLNLMELGAAMPLPVLLFQHNVESVIFKRHAETTSNPVKRWVYDQQWRATERYEQRAAALVDAQVTVSESDTDLFRSMGMTNVLGAVPTGVDCDFFQPPAQLPEKPVMAFLGSMDWDANQDAVLWFAHEILPRIRKEVPDAEFLGIGRNPPAALRTLAEQDPRIRLTGTVADVRPHMAEAAVMVLPLRIGGGTRIKVYEAMAMGTPVVSTRIGAEGLDVTEGRNILFGDTAETFAAAAVRALTRRSEAAAMAAEARSHVAAHYSWARVAGLFGDYCERAVGLGRERLSRGVENAR
jgi:glycosyltransferase involved in cell wall biosynthesis